MGLFDDIDLDTLFAYRSIKVVKILDRRLGFVYYGIQALIVLYIVVYVFAINEGYLARELALGQVHVKVMGATYAKVDGVNIPFDAVDLRQPAIESGAVFIITKVEMVSQRRGVCGNSEYQCAVDSDCPVIEGISSKQCVDGLCVLKGWCPALDPSADETVVLAMERPEDIVLWFRSAISFPTLKPNTTFSSMNHEQPIFSDDPGRTDAWTLKEILNMVEAPLGAVKTDGAMMNVRFDYQCDLDTGEGCLSPQPTVQRLDEGKVRGFSVYQPEYVYDQHLDPEKTARVLSKYTGVRILVTSKGIGKEVSVLQSVLQFSSGLALLSVAKTATDFLMLHMLPEKDHYRRYKEELTPDFSDLRDKIMETEAKRQKVRGKTNRYQALPGQPQV